MAAPKWFTANQEVVIVELDKQSAQAVSSTRFVQQIKKLYYKIFKCHRRLESRCVTYAEGDRLIRENKGKPECEQWQIAKEENTNRVIGVVYLERRERIVM